MCIQIMDNQIMDNCGNKNPNFEINNPFFGLPPLSVEVSFDPDDSIYTMNSGEYNQYVGSNESASLSMAQSQPMSPGLQEISFSDIQFLQAIGKGSFGVVYKAKWNGSGGGHIVAVKKVETDTELSAFNNEIRQLSRVTHENIIQMYGIASAKSVRCLIMEFADGGSLYQFLHCPPRPKYNLAHGLSWLWQCAKAIAYLHAFQPIPIIHRDLKPLNMLLTNSRRVLKVCDFGTACEIRSVMTDNRGSTAWMAPEVIRGGKYNEKCDVYSWGMILWEVLTRRVPFEEWGMAYRILWQIVNNVRPPPIQGCPEPIEKLMKRCWQDEHGERPTMQEVVDEIYPLCKLMMGGEDFCNYSSSSGESFTDSCLSPLNDGEDHTSQDVSEFTNSTNTDVPYPARENPADDTPDSQGTVESTCFGEVPTPSEKMFVHPPQLTYSPNVSACVVVGVEHLPPPWGSATSDDTNINSPGNSSHGADSKGHSPLLLPAAVSSPVRQSMCSPPILTDSRCRPTLSPSQSSSSSTSSPHLTPLKVDIPTERFTEQSHIANTNMHSSAIPNVGTPSTGSTIPVYTVSTQPSHLSFTVASNQPQMCNMPAFIPAGKPRPLSPLSLSQPFLHPSQQFVQSPPLPTTPPLTSVVTSLTLAPPTKATPRDSHMSAERSTVGMVTLRQNLVSHDPGAAYRRRSAEVTLNSPLHKAFVPGHRRSSSYESSELIGFEPLAKELEEHNRQNINEPWNEDHPHEQSVEDEGRINSRPDIKNPVHSQLPANFSIHPRGGVPSQLPSSSRVSAPLNLTVSSSLAGSSPNSVVRSPTRAAPSIPAPSTARGHASSVVSSSRTVAPITRRGPFVSTSDCAPNEELGAIWELLDEDLKPSMPQPSNPLSQQIFEEHKALAHQLLVVQEEIVFLDQEKNKLLLKLEEQDREQNACKKRYNDKIIQLQNKNDSLLLSHSRLSAQLEVIRNRRQKESPSHHQPTSPSTVQTQYFPQQRNLDPHNQWQSPHQQQYYHPHHQVQPPVPNLNLHHYYRDHPLNPHSAHQKFN